MLPVQTSAVGFPVVPDSPFPLAEVAIIVGLIVWSVAKLLPVIKEFMNGRKRDSRYCKTEGKCDADVKRLLHDIHSVVAREDDYGQKVFLGIPKYLKGFVDSNRRQEKILEEHGAVLQRMMDGIMHLVNHQNDVIEKIFHKDK